MSKLYGAYCTAGTGRECYPSPARLRRICELVAEAPEPLNPWGIVKDTKGTGMARNTASKCMATLHDEGAIIHREDDTWAVDRIALDRLMERCGPQSGGRPESVPGDGTKRGRILQVMQDAGRPLTSAEVAEALGMTKRDAATTLSNMAARGRIRGEFLGEEYMGRPVKSYVIEEAVQ